MKTVIEFVANKDKAFAEPFNASEPRLDPRPGHSRVDTEYEQEVQKLEQYIAAGRFRDPDATRRAFEDQRRFVKQLEMSRAIIRTFFETPSIYEIDPALNELLSEAKWKPDVLSDFVRLPKGRCIGLAVPKGAIRDEEGIPIENGGWFLADVSGEAWGHPEYPRALLVALAPHGAPVALFPLIDGEPIESAYNAVPVLDYRSNYVGVVHYAINVLLYLLGQRDLIEEIHPGIPPGKRGRNKPEAARHPFEVIKVGTNLGNKIRSMERYAEQAHSGSSAGQEHRASYRAHLRSAHFHTYRVGKGRVGTRIHLLATIVVNGVDHDLDELAKAGDVVKVS